MTDNPETIQARAEYAQQVADALAAEQAIADRATAESAASTQQLAAVREAQRLDEQDELRRHAAAHGGPQAREACEAQIESDDEVTE
jgi:hypothetical protein